MAALDIYSELDYKSAIRTRMKELSASGKAITLKEIARRIPVQYTYLSRVLKSDDKHLGDDHLFTLCTLLEFIPEDIEYLMALRSEATTTNLRRKGYLQNRIAHIRESKKLKALMPEFEGQSKETEYLFEPLCVVVHVSLGIEEYRKNPYRLCSGLGITRSRLKEILGKLRNVGFVELADDGMVSRVHRAHLHYSPQHPLMRAHQNFLRTACLSYLSRTDEEDRHSFMVTFSSDDNAFHEIKEAFRAYIQQVERRVVDAKNVHTYQIMFDLFKWM
jgi:hypothetical protein